MDSQGSGEMENNVVIIPDQPGTAGHWGCAAGRVARNRLRC